MLRDGLRDGSSGACADASAATSTVFLRNDRRVGAIYAKGNACNRERTCLFACSTADASGCVDSAACCCKNSVPDLVIRCSAFVLDFPGWADNCARAAADTITRWLVCEARNAFDGTSSDGANCAGCVGFAHASAKSAEDAIVGFWIGSEPAGLCAVFYCESLD